MNGKFYGIGVGPGRPDLLTLHAVKVLNSVDVICLPRSSVGSDSAAMKAAAPHIRPDADFLEISTPMTRDREVLEREWQAGAQAIAERLLQGKDAAFITIGDAMLFSTYTYLLKRVQKLVPGLEVESISGITSFSAAAAALNAPLAEANENLAVIPAVDDPKALRAIFAAFPNVVLMKVAGKYDEILDELREAGLTDRAAFISKIGYPEQKIIRDVESLRGTRPDYLSLIIVKREGF